MRAGRGHGLTPAAAKLGDGEGERPPAGVALRMRVTPIDGRLACSGRSFAAYAKFNAAHQPRERRRVSLLAPFRRDGCMRLLGSSIRAPSAIPRCRKGPLGRRAGMP